MSDTLSLNTKAILLLTAPLIGESIRTSSQEVATLTPKEYRGLARRLHELGREPADLLSGDIRVLLKECKDQVNADRVVHLLDRGAQLSLAVERWQQRSIWVTSRADPDYPAQIRNRLKEHAPPILYGCGEKTLLDGGGLAVVGSRSADQEALEFARRVGDLAARAEIAIVSGGARGVDQAAMRGTLELGGVAVGVLADSLERAVLKREHRDMIRSNRLTLISPFDPQAGFNVGNAMQRNKLIYALADAALIVQSDHNQGGTWHGALEQLNKFKLVPLYVRENGEVGDGNKALLRAGARPWPNPNTPDELREILSHAPSWRDVAPSGNQLRLDMDTEPVSEADVLRETSQHEGPYQPSTQPRPTELARAPAERLFEFVKPLLLELLQKPTTQTAVAELLKITKEQAKQWLNRLMEEGAVEKRKQGRGVVYVRCGVATLFEQPLER